MRDALTREVLQQMLPFMDNEQAMRLQSVLGNVLTKYEISEAVNAPEIGTTNEQMVTKFIEAKRIEGCSERTLAYYRKTIDAMLDDVGKEVMHIVTEDLRSYLTKYQESKQLSRVTVDNVRRILSSFFSWLEDEAKSIKMGNFIRNQKMNPPPYYECMEEDFFYWTERGILVNRLSARILTPQ